MTNRPLIMQATVYIEPGAESPERTFKYVEQALKSACRNIRDGSVTIVLQDGDGEVIGMDVTGSPSETLSKRISEAFNVPGEKEKVLNLP